MTEPIEAIYENGVFRPLTPVDLPRWTRVRVEVVLETVPLEEQIRQQLLSNGSTPDEAEKIIDNFRLVWDLYDSLTPEQQTIYDEAVS